MLAGEQAVAFAPVFVALVAPRSPVGVVPQLFEQAARAVFVGKQGFAVAVIERKEAVEVDFGADAVGMFVHYHR